MRLNAKKRSQKINKTNEIKKKKEQCDHYKDTKQ